MRAPDLSGDVFSSEDSESFANNLSSPFTRGKKKEEVQQAEHSVSTVKALELCRTFLRLLTKPESRYFYSLCHLASGHTFYTRVILTLLALEEIVFAISPSR